MNIYYISCSSFMLKLFVYDDFVTWKHYLKTGQFFLPPLLFFSPLLCFPFPSSFLFAFFFMNSSSNTELHSPCSCPQKRVMFLLRRIPFSTRHIPARRKGRLIKPSSGLTWLWLVACWLIKLSFKILNVSYFCFSKHSEVLLYSLFIMFWKT